MKSIYIPNILTKAHKEKYNFYLYTHPPCDPSSLLFNLPKEKYHIFSQEVIKTYILTEEKKSRNAL